MSIAISEVSKGDCIIMGDFNHGNVKWDTQQSTGVEFQKASSILEVNCERPDREEIRKAIGLLKTRTAHGPDEIPEETIKADMETSIEMLYELIWKIWDTEEIPTGWKEGYMVKIKKKGDLQECKNYRGSMLLSVPGKVLNIIILERLKNDVDSVLRDHASDKIDVA